MQFKQKLSEAFGLDNPFSNGPFTGPSTATHLTIYDNDSDHYYAYEEYIVSLEHLTELIFNPEISNVFNPEPKFENPLDDMENSHHLEICLGYRLLTGKAYYYVKLHVSRGHINDILIHASPFVNSKDEPFHIGDSITQKQLYDTIVMVQHKMKEKYKPSIGF